MTDGFHAERPSELDNPRAERVRRVAALTGRSARSRSGLLLVEGPQAVRELVRHRPGAVRDVYLDEHAEGAHPDVAEAARAATRWVHRVSAEVSRAMSGDAQGVVAVAGREAVGGGIPGGVRDALDPAPAGGVGAGEVIDEGGRSAPGRGAPGVVLVLVDAQDPGNAGTLIRTADAMGAVGVVVTAGSVDVRSPKVIRSSAGSVFHLPVLTGVGVAEAVEALHARGATVVGTSGRDGSLDLSDLLDDAATNPDSLLRTPHAWVMGNEARGLSAEEEGACDLLVRIPMSGQAESLNVASAAAMCLFASQHARSRGPARP